MKEARGPRQQAARALLAAADYLPLFKSFSKAVKFPILDGISPVQNQVKTAKKGGWSYWSDHFRIQECSSRNLIGRKRKILTSQLVIVQIEVFQGCQIRYSRRNGTFTKSSQNSKIRGVVVLVQPLPISGGRFRWFNWVKLSKY